MNQLRLDPLTGRWIAVSIDPIPRSGSLFIPPNELESTKPAKCPLCETKGKGTQKRPSTGVADETSLPRIVANPHPAFEGSDPFVVTHKGPVFSEAPASGVHEILVFSRDHKSSWASFDDHLCALVMGAARDRIEEHQNTPGMRYSQFIVNAGHDAGASLEHPHGQLLAIPFVPREVADEQAGFARYAGGCLLCSAAASEERVGYRTVSTGPNTVVFAPFWSGTPYEMLVVPRRHETHLHHASPSDLSGVGTSVRDALAAMRAHLGDVSYNIVFHAAPYRASSTYHWHVHILPKLATREGFELGTGVYVNVVAPETAADELRRALSSLRTKRFQVPATAAS